MTKEVKYIDAWSSNLYDANIEKLCREVESLGQISYEEIKKQASEAKDPEVYLEQLYKSLSGGSFSNLISNASCYTLTGLIENIYRVSCETIEEQAVSRDAEKLNEKWGLVYSPMAYNALFLNKNAYT